MQKVVITFRAAPSFILLPGGRFTLCLGKSSSTLLSPFPVDFSHIWQMLNLVGFFPVFKTRIPDVKAKRLWTPCRYCEFILFCFIKEFQLSCANAVCRQDMTEKWTVNGNCSWYHILSRKTAGFQKQSGRYACWPNSANRQAGLMTYSRSVIVVNSYCMHFFFFSFLFLDVMPLLWSQS